MDKKTFGPDVGGLKGKTTRSKSLPTQSRATDVPRELLSLHEEVETSLDGLHMNGKLFIKPISHETHCRTAIPTDGEKKKMLVKAVDDIFQVYC